MKDKNFSTVIESLSADTPYAYVFVVQASNPNGVSLTSEQIDDALAAAKSALGNDGAEVAGSCSVIPLDPVGENERARLLINCKQETETISVETLADQISDGEEANDSELGLADIDEAE